MLIYIGKLFYFISHIIERLICKYQLSTIEHGKGCRIEGKGRFTSNNIYFGKNVTVGSHSIFLSSDANIIIGNHVMFGPHVLIASGNHRTDVVGEYMTDVKDKLPENDVDVIIEDDVWIGMGSIILKGVRIGKGSIIGAGCVITRNVSPYSIIIGNPIRKELQRFTSEEVRIHEEIILKNHN